MQVNVNVKTTNKQNNKQLQLPLTQCNSIQYSIQKNPLRYKKK